MSLSINPKFLSGLMTTDQELLNEAQVRQDADAALQSNIDDEASARQSADAAEAAAREAAIAAEASAREAGVLEAKSHADASDALIQSRIDSEVLALQSKDSQLQNQVDAAVADIGTVMTELYETQINTTNQFSAVQSSIETEKSRIDAILSASEADKDSFAEIVSLINSVDTTNDQAFAGYVSSNDARVSEVESDLAQEVLDRQAADSAISSSLAQEVLDRQAADSAISSSLAQEVLDRQAADSAEASARQTADAGLQSQVDDLDAYAQDIRSDLDSLDGYAQDIRSDVDLIQSSISSEASARQLADQGLQSQIDTEKSRIDAILSAADEDKNSFAEISSLIESTSSSLESSISSEASARQLADQGLQSQIDTEKSRIDAILSASEADKDSFAEIVTLINSIDTSNNEGFASYVISNDARVSEVESDLAQEVLDRQAADSALDQRISPMEDILEFQKAVVYENNSAVYADAQPGVEDSSLRPGWYYKNSVAGQKINWYFFDGINQANVSLGSISGYAVMTFDSVSPVKSPIMAVYTMPTGTNDVMPGFAHSRVVYNGLSATPVAGKKYLVYFGQNPAIHPELPRLQLSVSTGASAGERSPSERVLTTSFGSNSGDAANTVQFMVEALGISSSSFKSEAELKIRPASLKKLEDITSRLAAVEDNGFSNGSVTVGEELGYTDLDRQYTKLMSVAIGRLSIHEGEDFTVSVVGGKTRLTWINSLAIGGDQAIQSGDRIFFVGAY